jgi:hypothetical protein
MRFIRVLLFGVRGNFDRFVTDFVTFFTKGDQIPVRIIPRHQELSGHPVYMILPMMNHQVGGRTAIHTLVTVPGEYL